MRATVYVAIVGPESTGKTTLAQRLAAAYGTRWVPEYARAYLDRRPDYGFSDVVRMARGQLALEAAEASRARRWLICDTNLLVIAVWLAERYQTVPAWIDAHLRDAPYVYLLTRPDIPWEPDPQREHPHLREELFGRYEAHLRAMGKPYEVVSGNSPVARLRAAQQILSSGD